MSAATFICGNAMMQRCSCSTMRAVAVTVFERAGAGQDPADHLPAGLPA